MKLRDNQSKNPKLKIQKSETQNVFQLHKRLPKFNWRKINSKTINSTASPEIGRCVKVEVAVLGPNIKPYGFCGRKATLKRKAACLRAHELY